MGRGGGAANFLKRARSIRAVELRLPVYYHLRRINILDRESIGILLLPLGVQTSRKAILPSELVPVIDVLAQDDDIGLRDWLGLFETGE